MAAPNKAAPKRVTNSFNVVLAERVSSLAAQMQVLMKQQASQSPGQLPAALALSSHLQILRTGPWLATTCRLGSKGRRTKACPGWWAGTTEAPASGGAISSPGRQIQPAGGHRPERHSWGFYRGRRRSCRRTWPQESPVSSCRSGLQKAESVTFDAKDGGGACTLPGIPPHVLGKVWRIPGSGFGRGTHQARFGLLPLLPSLH